MTDESWFAADVGSDFEESVRIDREDDGRDHRLESIDTYHVTEESEEFMSDFLSRLLGRSEDMRSGANYWLYGYYGSGKSHLLSVLGGLMDSEWLRQRDDVWEQLAGGRELETLETTWASIHDEYEVIPVSVNLLKHQGQKELSFSEIVLQSAHTSDRLTGVEGGLSPQLDVAYFEDWYRTTDAWGNRTANTETVLEGTVSSPGKYDWQDVQQYTALADVVLPSLFEQQTGTADGLDDLTPSDLNPEAMVKRLEQMRSDREEELGQPIKLVLLLDEVSLFIGTDFDRLTELQTLAESVDEVGDGDIQLVATAQAKIEDVQPQFAARGADFSIVKDRFPHRFGLPSRHVGEISTQRLLKKTSNGRTNTERVLEQTNNQPETLLVYSSIEQNTEPPLDDIDRERLLDFYPFLPYQPSLFLEILSNLRQEAHDPAKSIFSGTARAILALVHGLLEEWMAAGNEADVISLVDFYDLIEPELDDITPQDVAVIEEIEEQYDAGELEKIDVDVAKAVLLLQHIPDTIPMSERNLAVAILSDLDGPTQFQMENRVEDSLQRLRKFIRPTHEETGPKYAFTHPEEREIIEASEQNLNHPDWQDIIEAIDGYLWGDIDDSPDTIEQMQDLLTSEGVDAVANKDEPVSIVAATRGWAVAEWLIHAGADAEQFPKEFRAETAGNHDLPELKSVLNNTTSPALIADRYLGETMWPDVIADVDDPWELADCIVDAALERRLWEEWHASFDAGDYEECLNRAEERYDALLGSEDFRGNYRGAYGPDSPWTRTWEQAAEIARLAHQLETWEESATDDDVVSLYADADDGTWQIDNAMLNLVVSGDPETDLPGEHPATDTLDHLRTHLQSEYVAYLEDLGDLVTETVEAGAPFVDEDHAYQFFTKESDGLESGQTVALFVIDALRLDLARRLADELRNYVATLPSDAPEFAIDEDVWLGTLPSETEFGKAALTPGEIQMFDVSLIDGELQPLRNNRRVTNNRRESLLNGDGWTITREEDDGWQSTRVAYYKNDLDDIGEKELSDLEGMLARRVDSLAEFIGTKLEQGEWDQAYVLTDHGFVLLPEDASPEKISRPSEASDSGRRWIAGEDVDGDSPGVLLDGSTRLGYLDANVSVLASPLKRFRKQGLGDARFYHGGLLPQEFVLDFISITQG